MVCSRTVLSLLVGAAALVEAKSSRAKNVVAGGYIVEFEPSEVITCPMNQAKYVLTETWTPYTGFIGFLLRSWFKERYSKELRLAFLQGRLYRVQ